MNRLFYLTGYDLNLLPEPEPTPMDPVLPWFFWVFVAGVCLAVGLAVMTVLLLLHHRKKKRAKQQEAASPQETAMEDTSLADAPVETAVSDGERTETSASDDQMTGEAKE